MGIRYNTVYMIAQFCTFAPTVDISQMAVLHRENNTLKDNTNTNTN